MNKGDRRICDECGDRIRFTPVTLLEKGVVRFVIDRGCALKFDARGVIKIKGSKYKLKHELLYV